MKILRKIRLMLGVAILATIFTGCGTDDKSDNGNSEIVNSENSSALEASTIPFIFKVKTVESNGNKITIGDSFSSDRGENQFYSVDWGDGTSDNNLKKGIEHTYPSSGVYTITISGIYPIKGQIRGMFSIEQWGDMQWTSMRSAFLNRSITFNSSDTPHLTKVTDMSQMFFGAEDFNADLSSWDVSHVTNMNVMFVSAKKFNSDISSWNVSNVTSMVGIFSGAENFNSNLDSWDISHVTNMQSMFRDSGFNKNINSWDVSKVTNMSFMFSGAKKFNQDISSWNVSQVTDMTFMFQDASSFNQDISSWNILKAKKLSVAGTNLSIANYDKMLMKWVNSDMPNNFYLKADNLKYSKQAESARFELINKHGWTIKDGGLAE